MTALMNRSAADSLLAELDSFTRAAKAAPDELPDDEDDVDIEEDEGGGEGAEGGAAPTEDELEQMKSDILDAVKEQLDWDGESGDPNASKDALEDALGDMFDADVEILFDGKSKLTLHVEGEEPVVLTPDYLAELLEELAKQGGDGEDDTDEVEEDGESDVDEDEDETERAYQVIWQRGGKLDIKKHLHAPPGIPGGGQFISKGGGGGIVSKAVAGAKAVAAKTPAGKLVAGAAKLAPRTPAGKLAKAAAKTPGGKLAAGAAKLAAKTPAGKLAARARGRAGPRRTAKAVGGALSAGIGSRVKVSGNKDGSFNIGTGSNKKKLSSKQVGHILLASWVAFGVGSVFIGGLGLPILAATAATASQAAIVTKIVRGVREKRRIKAAAKG